MVQVDVFWSFALGAGFAACAARQLKKEEKPFESKYFVKTLLYLSILFVPSGATLLWGFPEWETMQAGTYKTIPAWLVMLFSITNVTQGILGYWLGYRLVRKGNGYGAWLLVVIGYFCMFFILVHGWDGMGFQRFFYICTWYGSDECVPWSKGSYAVLKWAKGPVALTLYAMGAVMLPVLFYWMTGFIKSGYDAEGIGKQGAKTPSRLGMLFIILRLVFIHSLGAAIVASILVHKMGWILGIIAFIVLFMLIEIKGLKLLRREAGLLKLEKV
jgi:hypothetical protein